MNIDGNIAALNDYLRRQDAEDAWEAHVAQVGRDMKADLLDGLQVCCGSYFATYDDFITVAIESHDLEGLLREVHAASCIDAAAFSSRLDAMLDAYVARHAEARASWLRD